jgi:hypothetical protein
MTFLCGPYALIQMRCKPIYDIILSARLEVVIQCYPIMAPLPTIRVMATSYAGEQGELAIPTFVPTLTTKPSQDIF